MEVVALLVTLVLDVYFVITTEIGKLDSLLMRGRGMRFLLRYLGFTLGN